MNVGDVVDHGGKVFMKGCGPVGIGRGIGGGGRFIIGYGDSVGSLDIIGTTTCDSTVSSSSSSSGRRR